MKYILGLAPPSEKELYWEARCGCGHARHAHLDHKDWRCIDCECARFNDTSPAEPPEKP